MDETIIESDLDDLLWAFGCTASSVSLYLHLLLVNVEKYAMLVV